MTTALLDLFRAGIRGQTTKQQSQVMIYTLAHAPGNTATSWRRNFYNYREAPLLGCQLVGL